MATGGWRHAAQETVVSAAMMFAYEILLKHLEGRLNLETDDKAINKVLKHIATSRPGKVFSALMSKTGSNTAMKPGSAFTLEGEILSLLEAHGFHVDGGMSGVQAVSEMRDSRCYDLTLGSKERKTLRLTLANSNKPAATSSAVSSNVTDKINQLRAFIYDALMNASSIEKVAMGTLVAISIIGGLYLVRAISQPFPTPKSPETIMPAAYDENLAADSGADEQAVASHSESNDREQTEDLQFLEEKYRCALELLVEKSSLIESFEVQSAEQHGDISNLTAQNRSAAQDIIRLSQEVSEVKKQCDDSDEQLATKDDTIWRLECELKAEKDKSRAKDVEIEKLVSAHKALDDANVEHVAAADRASERERELRHELRHAKLNFDQAAVDLDRVKGELLESQEGAEEIQKKLDKTQADLEETAFDLEMMKVTAAPESGASEAEVDDGDDDGGDDGDAIDDDEDEDGDIASADGEAQHGEGHENEDGHDEQGPANGEGDSEQGQDKEHQRDFDEGNNASDENEDDAPDGDHGPAGKATEGENDQAGIAQADNQPTSPTFLLAAETQQPSDIDAASEFSRLPSIDWGQIARIVNTSAAINPPSPTFPTTPIVFAASSPANNHGTYGFRGRKKATPRTARRSNIFVNNPFAGLKLPDVPSSRQYTLPELPKQIEHSEQTSDSTSDVSRSFSDSNLPPSETSVTDSTSPTPAAVSHSPASPPASVRNAIASDLPVAESNDILPRANVEDEEHPLATDELAESDLTPQAKIEAKQHSSTTDTLSEQDRSSSTPSTDLSVSESEDVLPKSQTEAGECLSTIDELTDIDQSSPTSSTTLLATGEDDILPKAETDAGEYLSTTDEVAEHDESLSTPLSLNEQATGDNFSEKQHGPAAEAVIAPHANTSHASSTSTPLQDARVLDFHSASDVLASAVESPTSVSEMLPPDDTPPATPLDFSQSIDQEDLFHSATTPVFTPAGPPSTPIAAYVVDPAEIQSPHSPVTEDENQDVTDGEPEEEEAEVPKKKKRRSRPRPKMSLFETGTWVKRNVFAQTRGLVGIFDEVDVAPVVVLPRERNAEIAEDEDFGEGRWIGSGWVSFA